MGFEGVADSYDTVADRYRRVFERELDHKPEDRRLLADLAVEAKARGPVLDLGSGPGHVGRHLVGLGCTVAALDLSLAMARHCSAAGTPALVGDLAVPPLRDRSLGGLVAFYSLIHLRRAEVVPALVAVGRALRPGAPVLASVHAGEGELHTTEFLEHDVPFAATLFDGAELAAMATTAGLVDIVVIERAPYPTEHPTRRLYLRARAA